jgi:hypothetical protein
MAEDGMTGRKVRHRSRATGIKASRPTCRGYARRLSAVKGIDAAASTDLAHVLLKN